MNEFDDRARAASERLRRRAIELAAGVDRDARIADQATSSSKGRPTARWLIAACAVTAVVAGVIGVLSFDREQPSIITDDDRLPTSMVATPAPTTSSTSTSTSTTSAAAAPVTVPPDVTASAPLEADVVRPVVDPTVCESFSAIDGSLAGLPLNPGNLALTLFGRPSSAPIPIQIIGDPVDGPTKPFALIQRTFDAETEPTGQDTVDVNGVTVWVTAHPDGDGEAVWNLPDGSQGYLRSRGLDRDDVVAILTALTPRSPDSAIPGFDYGTGPAGLGLVTEQLNTDVIIGNLGGSHCRVAGTGSVYRIWSISGGTLYQFASVIDRPVPVDVGITNGTLTVISGPADPTAPTVEDVINADESTWLELLARPANDLGGDPRVEPIGDGLDVVVELVPIDTRQPTSFLTLRLSDRDGVAVFEVFTANAVIADGAQYWRTDIDGRMRLRTTAHAGGVIGSRLADGPLTTEFTVNISTTDGDDFIIQTTGNITLQPQP